MSPAKKLNIPCDRDERLHYIKRQFVVAKGTDLHHEWAGVLMALKNSIVLML